MEQDSGIVPSLPGTCYSPGLELVNGGSELESGQVSCGNLSLSSPSSADGQVSLRRAGHNSATTGNY